LGKIILLDDALSNKIAAGEVVERPASVVKELVENSIDAGSTIIEIEVEEAGLSKIKVIDNGAGIEEEDVLVAFERHATSKIKNENDLFRIRTLGFRGEALPSIASVSRVEIITSTGTAAGTRAVIEGGKVLLTEKANSRKGTEITITDLFFNTPARLKYMKTIHTELGNITDLVNRLALAHPEVSFRLIHNGRKLLSTNGNGDVRQVLAAIYGMNIVKKMVPVSGTSLDYTITGYASLPEVTRASRNYISTMVNGRFIKNYSLIRAIQDGYHTLLPIGRYPIVFINIEMDPILVDVNVHPSKLEVRFSKEQELNTLVTEMIKSAFKTKELIPSGFISPKTARPKTEQTELVLDHLPEKAILSDDLHKGGSLVFNNDFLHEPSSSSTVEHSDEQEPETNEISRGFSLREQGNKEDVYQIETQEMDVSSNDSVEPVVLEDSPDGPRDSIDAMKIGTDPDPEQTRQPGAQPASSRIPPLYPIGQMHGTYILAQNDKGLYLIDQHAAQERIKYEYFKEKVGQVETELQELLVPITLEYSVDETIKINENKDKLEQVGVFLEEFGLNSYIVRAHPVWFPKGEEKQIIEEMIEQVLTMKKVDIKKLREEAAIMMSCKGSIKANRHLRNDEIQALLDELRTTTDPFTCPHGRPIIIHFSTYELEKMFKRVM
jgi:DNA mismatch repair protein MutL